MNIVELAVQRVAPREVRDRVNHRAWHRLAAVRRSQCITRSTLARCMNVDVAEIRRQEKETSDLPLSALYAWQKVLGVPVTELLVDAEDVLSQPVRQRAKLVRLMKTAMSLLDLAAPGPEQCMAHTLVELLIKIMPELRGVSAWNIVGERRTLDELGIAAMRMLPEDLFHKRPA